MLERTRRGRQMRTPCSLVGEPGARLQATVSVVCGTIGLRPDPEISQVAARCSPITDGMKQSVAVTGIHDRAVTWSRSGKPLREAVTEIRMGTALFSRYGQSLREVLKPSPPQSRLRRRRGSRRRARRPSASGPSASGLSASGASRACASDLSGVRRGPQGHTGLRARVCTLSLSILRAARPLSARRPWPACPSALPGQPACGAGISPRGRRGPLPDALPSGGCRRHPPGLIRAGRRDRTRR